MIPLNKLRIEMGLMEPYHFNAGWNVYRGIAVHFYKTLDYNLSFTWTDALFDSEENEEKHHKLETNDHECSRSGGYHNNKPIIGICGFSLNWYSLSIDTHRNNNKIMFRVHPDILLDKDEMYGYSDIEALYDFSELIE